MNLDLFMENLDFNKIPDEQKEGFLCAKERIWKTESGTFIPIEKLSDEFIGIVISWYLENNFIPVREYLLGNTDGKRTPTIWLDLLTDEMEARHGKRRDSG